MIRETTPARITQVIIDFCASITSDSSPEYIDVCPASWATPNECFNNVPRMVKQYGGSMISGWAVWQRGNMLLDAEAHAIWRTPDGKLIDITTPSASAPAAVFTMFLVSTTSVKFPFSSILQIPRVTPPLSDRVFFRTKPAMQDLPPFTKYSWTALKPSLP